MLSPLIGLSRCGLSSCFNSARGDSKRMTSVLTGVDVGTSKVCVLIAEIEPEGGIAVLGFGVAPCSGLRRGVVANIEATVEALRAAISEAEKSAGVGVGAAAVSISGAHIHGLNSHGIVAVRGGEVGPRGSDSVGSRGAPYPATAVRGRRSGARARSDRDGWRPARGTYPYRHRHPEL